MWKQSQVTVVMTHTGALTVLLDFHRNREKEAFQKWKMILTESTYTDVWYNRVYF